MIFCNIAMQIYDTLIRLTRVDDVSGRREKNKEIE
jgi:hypothetical protein